MISWNGQSTDNLRIKSTILLRPARRITTILTLTIMLAKQKQLGIQYYSETKKNWLSYQDWLLVTDGGDKWPSLAKPCIWQAFHWYRPNLASNINPPWVMILLNLVVAPLRFNYILLVLTDCTKFWMTFLRGYGWWPIDGIPTCLQKLSFTFIASSLTHIFNTVISSGIIPKDWKSARVTPINFIKQSETMA